MSMTQEPDYICYSLEQLQRACRRIDSERFPERSRVPDVLFANRQLRAETEPGHERVPPLTSPPVTEHFRHGRRHHLPVLGRCALAVIPIAGGALRAGVERETGRNAR